jgi:type I restriction enzyme, S subunit
MIAEFKPYPAMKDCGVPWLGDVPEHWAVLPNRVVFTEVKERERPDEQMLSVTITRGVIPQQSLLADSSKKDSSNLDKSAYKLVRPGDIAYNKMRAWQGAIGASVHRGIVSPAYVVQRPRDGVDSRYFHYLFRTPAFAKEAERWSYGITSDMWSLRPEHFKLIYSCLPPLPEQAAIVRFLDHVDRRIRRYIRAKQKLIKLLEEQKQAIIHRAVTSGIDPDVRLKPSGVEWLGDVPEHWEVRRLRSIVQRIDQGVSPQAENYLAEGDAWGVLKAGCVNRGVFRQSEHKRLPAEYEIDPSLAIMVGDVLVSRASGSPQLVGSVGRVNSLQYKLILSDKTFRVVFERSVDAEFMVLAMNSRLYRQQVEQAISGAEGLANNLQLSSLRSFVFAIPPMTEQTAIAGYLHNSTTDLRKVMEGAEREIALLREFRTRLIADVVTGKVDVREAAARLPEEVEVAETADEIEERAEGEEEIGDADLESESEEAEA